MHRLLNPLGFAAGQLAVFQGGPSRTGGKRRYLDHSGRASNRKQPTAAAHRVALKWSAASLVVSHVSIKICSFLPPRRRPTLNATSPSDLEDGALTQTFVAVIGRRNLDVANAMSHQKPKRLLPEPE